MKFPCHSEKSPTGFGTVDALEFSPKEKAAKKVTPTRIILFTKEELKKYNKKHRPNRN
ncbi:hypothetical protein PESHB4_12550 [Pediococcus ethanolidurans]